MKKYLFLCFTFLFLFSIDSVQANKTVDCDQVHMDVRKSLVKKGLTNAEAENIADAAYSGCLNGGGTTG